MKKTLKKAHKKFKALCKNTKKAINYKGKNVFDVIDIETTSICTRKCEYCPNKFSDRKQGYMTDNLYKQIIDDLGSINFIGSIRPHFYGEPLVDKRIFEFVKYAKEKCPKANITIKTNGDLLTYEKTINLFKNGVSTILVTMHDGFFTDTVKNIKKRLPNNLKEKFIARVIKVYYENRGVDLEKNQTNEAQGKDCDFPKHTIFIDFKGKAVLCGSDFYGKIVLGDKNHDKLVSIWNNEKYNEIRKKLKEGKRSELEVCNACNHYEGIANTGETIILK